MEVPNYVDVVRAVKQELVAKGINVDASEASRAEITFRAADRIHHVDQRVGLLFKNTGNQVEERAVDILCFPDGTIVDVLGAGSEGPNTPMWMVNAVPVDPSRWRTPFTFAEVALPMPPRPPTPEPTPDPPVPPVPVTVPPIPPIREPPLSQPGGTVSVGAGLNGLLQAAGAWMGQQLVTALMAWLQKRKTPKPVGTVGSAIPRAQPPSRVPKPPR